MHPYYLQNQFSQNKRLSLPTQRLITNKDFFQNNNNFTAINQMPVSPFFFNIQKHKQHINYTPKTPSPPHRRNVIDLSDNSKFKKPLQSPVFYRKLKGIESINDSPQIKNRVLRNVPQMPIYKPINNNENSNTLSSLNNSPQYNTLEIDPKEEYKNTKKRNIVINRFNLRKLSHDNIPYNMNILQNNNNNNTLKVNKNKQINSNNPVHQPNNINLNNFNNFYPNQNHYYKNNLYNHQNNINLKIFNALIQKHNHQNSLNITPFHQNRQNHIILNNNNIVPNNQNYNNNLDISKINKYKKSHSHDSIDISNNNIFQNQIYNNKVDINKKNDKIRLTYDNMNNIDTNNNDNCLNISRNQNNLKQLNITNPNNNLSAKNKPAIYLNTVQNIHVGIQQNQINIIQIPKKFII